MGNMRISATEEYGLRCLLQLARLATDGQVSASSIAEAEGISLQYASKMMHLFRKGGLVESVRGLHGGFRLSRPAQEISLLEIFATLGKQTGHRDFCEKYSGDNEQCVHYGGCSVRPVWTTLSNYFDSVLRELKLADLLGDERQVELRVSNLPGLELRRAPVKPLERDYQ